MHFTDDPKDEAAPDNLFAPLPQHDTVEGTVGNHALPHSLYTWVRLQTPVRAVGAVLGLAPSTTGTARTR
ncbi:MAG TPA: hypothetical protein VER39_10515 [Nocardioidaceae bacterium]|nr:hypothetical protein [Nocardioidaceae bacterium]